MTRNKLNLDPLADPHVQIIVQPTSTPIRFRYECEGRTAGTIPGENYKTEAKTFPTIKIMNCTGSVVIVASCVTKSKPYRPHPNNLVGKDGCKFGISSIKMDVSPDNNEYEYQNMGIQCVRKTDVAASLDIRKKKNVDPFSTGFDAKQKIQMDVVRICFQVFLRTQRPDGSFKNLPLPPVVTNPIYDKKSTNDLLIVKTSEPVGPAEGGTEMIILCEKVIKEDIKVRFFKRMKDEIVWSKFADLKPQNVHRQVAMSFRTPAFPKIGIQDEPVEVMLELYRPSDGNTSMPTPFIYLPYGYTRNNPQIMKRKHSNIDQSKELHDYLNVNPPNKQVIDAINSVHISHHRDQPYILNIPNNKHRMQTDTNHLPQSFEENIAPNYQKRREITPNNSTVQPKKEPKFNNHGQKQRDQPKQDHFDPGCLVDAILNICSPQMAGDNVQASDVLQPQTALNNNHNNNYPLIDISEPNNYQQQAPSNTNQITEFTNWNQLESTIEHNYLGPSDFLLETTSMQQQNIFQQTPPLQVYQPNYIDMNHTQNQMLHQPNYQQLSNVSFTNQQLNNTEQPLYLMLPNDTQHDIINKYDPFTEYKHNPVQQQRLLPFQDISQLPANHANVSIQQHQPQQIQSSMGQTDKNQSVPSTMINVTEAMANMTDSLSSLSMNE